MSVLLVLVFTLALSTGTIERALDVMLAKQEQRAVERLSQRAAEGHTLLARGRTIGYVADELVIAQNTAKGYVKNVYAKLGIHSRQELIDAVEELYLRM